MLHLSTALIHDTEEEAEEQAGKLIEQFRKENPGLEEYVEIFHVHSAHHS